MTAEQRLAAVPALLPCPFCGGEAHVNSGQRVGTRDHGWRWVRCRSCGAQSGGRNEGSEVATIAAVVSAWNARHG